MVDAVENACRQLSYLASGVSTEKVNYFSELPSEIIMAAPMMTLFSLPYKNWYGGAKAFYNAPKGGGSSAWKAYWDGIKQQKAHLTDNSSKFNTILNNGRYKEVMMYNSQFIPQNKAITPEKFAELSAKQQAKYLLTETRKGFYSEVQRLADEAKTLKGDALKSKLEEIRKAYANAKLAEHNANLTPVTKRGKIAKLIKDKSGYNKVKGKLLETATKSTKTGKFLRGAGKQLHIHGKGMGIWAAIAAISEIKPIMEAYSIDKELKAEGKKSNRGTKQLVKSATKVGTGILGYAAGAAAAGAIAGSVVPGIGNVAGAIVGFIGGCIGGAIANFTVSKVWNACTKEDDFEKNESEIYAKEVADDYVKEMMKSGKERDKFLEEISQELYDEEGNFLGDEEIAKYLETMLQDKEIRLTKKEEIIKRAQATCDRLSNLSNFATTI